ncbi:MAG: carboxypeptidase-like regulatory domain-containing protein [Candidatus Tumulicola sp.]
MNRTGIFVSASLVSFLLAAPAGAQVPLIVGSVRDQHGAAIGGARIVGQGPSGTPLAETTTDGVGTFALSKAGVVAVEIACRYCESRTLGVVPDQPVVAIVRRFDALFDDSPSPRDLANLPYSHIESAVALHPFALLRQTTGVLPGSELSDRGLSPENALLVDAGAPDYDVVLGSTPYDTIPAMYEQAGSVAPASNAFLYGDRAGSGIVSLAPFGGDDADVALSGSDQTLRLQAGSDFARVAAGTFSNDSESRQRSDAELTFPLSTTQTLSFNGGTSQDRDYANSASTLNGSYSFANATFDDAQASSDVHASFVADRGGYTAAEGNLPVTDIWSDSNFTAGVSTRGPVVAFADVSNRLSTGIYDASAYDAPPIGGTITQNRLDLGVAAAGRDADVTAGVGFFGVDYTGGSDGTSVPSSAHLATPSLAVRLFPNSKWSADLDASGSFTLPTLWQQYGFNGGYQGLIYDRNSLYSAMLSYTDDARVRVSVEAASQHVNGFTNGLITSEGLSVSWQIAPAISLRAWTMHVGDSTAPSYADPYYPAGEPSNVNAMWLTYDNGGALRIDAIYRRDILDGQPFEHVDGAVSGRITDRLRWFAGAEDRQRTERVDVGLRFSSP